MDPAALRRKIHGCWLGKAIGGTLGTPHEGQPGPLALSFYDPVPTRALPNDDLDLQVVWLHFLRQHRLTAVTPERLADAWQEHVLFPFDEYGIARRNRAWGLHGAAQGATDNFFGECMGAAIRSEIWACLAPGDPARAAGFAWADAVVDHCGDGVWAEVFHAALESAAFVESDRDRLLDTALPFLPDDSRLKRALTDTIRWWHQSTDWRKVRQQVIDRYYPGNFTDVVCNLCFELIGWFEGGGDFGRSICTAVNCGQDTDCTGATLGALLGILDPDCIPETWRRPIGEEVVLNRTIVNLSPPRTLTELTDWTLEVGRQLSAHRPGIGPVHPRRPLAPADSHRAIPVEHSSLADLHGLASATPPPVKDRAAGSLGGFWSHWGPSDFPDPVHILRLPFNCPPDGTIKLMVFYTPGAAAWVDGRRVLSVHGDAIKADPFIAPSFHRAGSTAVEIRELRPGRNELVLALARPPPAGADLVFGFGDPRTNLWLPEAVSPPPPIRRATGTE